MKTWKRDLKKLLLRRSENSLSRWRMFSISWGERAALAFSLLVIIRDLFTVEKRLSSLRRGEQFVFSS